MSNLETDFLSHEDELKDSPKSSDVELLNHVLGPKETDTTTDDCASGSQTLSPPPSQVSLQSTDLSQDSGPLFRATSAQQPAQSPTSDDDPINPLWVQALGDYKRFDPSCKQKGSRVTGLALEDSDVDLLTQKNLEEINAFFIRSDESTSPTPVFELPTAPPQSVSAPSPTPPDQLDADSASDLKQKMRVDLTLLHARVPRIVLEHENGIKLDIIHISSDGYSNARDELMRCCVAFDPRVKDYLLRVKQWTKDYTPQMDPKRHYPNTYLMSCVAIFVLQNLEAPALPRLKNICTYHGYITFDLESFAKISERSVERLAALVEKSRTIDRTLCEKNQCPELKESQFDFSTYSREQFDELVAQAKKEAKEYAERGSTSQDLFDSFLDFVYGVKPNSRVDLFHPLVYEDPSKASRNPQETDRCFLGIVEPVDKTFYTYNQKRVKIMGQCAVHQYAKFREERQQTNRAIPDIVKIVEGINNLPGPSGEDEYPVDEENVTPYALMQNGYGEENNNYNYYPDPRQPRPFGPNFQQPYLWRYPPYDMSYPHRNDAYARFDQNVGVYQTNGYDRAYGGGRFARRARSFPKKPSRLHGTNYEDERRVGGEEEMPFGPRPIRPMPRYKYSSNRDVRMTPHHQNGNRSLTRRQQRGMDDGFSRNSPSPDRSSFSKNVNGKGGGGKSPGKKKKNQRKSKKNSRAAQTNTTEESGNLSAGPCEERKMDQHVEVEREIVKQQKEQKQQDQQKGETKGEALLANGDAHEDEIDVRQDFMGREERKHDDPVVGEFFGERYQHEDYRRRGRRNNRSGQANSSEMMSGPVKGRREKVRVGMGRANYRMSNSPFDYDYDGQPHPQHNGYWADHNYSRRSHGGSRRPQRGGSRSQRGRNRSYQNGVDYERQNGGGYRRSRPARGVYVRKSG